MKKLTLLFFISVLTVTIATSQILSPQELIAIHSLKDVKDITLKLSETGYKENDGWNDIYTRRIHTGRSFTWHFQNKLEEPFHFLLTRNEEKSGNIETHYWISNVYLYKQFVDKLLKEKYKVEGVTVIPYKNKEEYKVKGAGKSYMIFKRKNISFLTTELASENNEASYLVIIKGSTVSNKETQPLTAAKNH